MLKAGPAAPDAAADALRYAAALLEVRDLAWDASDSLRNSFIGTELPVAEIRLRLLPVETRVIDVPP